MDAKQKQILVGAVVVVCLGVVGYLAFGRGSGSDQQSAFQSGPTKQVEVAPASETKTTTTARTANRSNRRPTTQKASITQTQDERTKKVRVRRGAERTKKKKEAPAF